MSPAPADLSDKSKIDRYAEGWTGLMDLVRNGHSWSGNERNRFFLNDRKGGFRQASRLGGFDFPDDGRGMAVVDWDQDGDLDLWFRNRTAPRLRLMRNRVADGTPSLALRLEGTRSNRDGIGAVVEILTEHEGARLVRSVRAGDLFLSQSSKWLHFGLGDAGPVAEATVLWPGGTRESFTGLAAGGRFVLKEGTGVAAPWQAKATRTASALEQATDLTVPIDDGIARILLPNRVPMPTLAYRDAAAQALALRPDGKPRLVVIWSSACPHCRKELRDLAEAAGEIRAAGLDVLALSVDGPNGPADDTSDAYSLIDRLQFPLPWGFLDGAALARVRQFQTALFDRTPADTVPLALLLDEGGRAVALHRGPFAIADVLSEWQAIKGADAQQLYHLAPPLSGTWFTNPLAPAHVEAFMARRVELQR